MSASLAFRWPPGASWVPPEGLPGPPGWPFGGLPGASRGLPGGFPEAKNSVLVSTKRYFWQVHGFGHACCPPWPSGCLPGLPGCLPGGSRGLPGGLSEASRGLPGQLFAVPEALVRDPDPPVLASSRVRTCMLASLAFRGPSGASRVPRGGLPGPPGWPFGGLPGASRGCKKHIKTNRFFATFRKLAGSDVHVSQLGLPRASRGLQGASRGPPGASRGAFRKPLGGLPGG